MLHLTSCLGAFSKPWHKEHLWHKRLLEETRTDRNKIDQGTREKKRLEAKKIAAEGRHGWELTKHISPEDEALREDSLEALTYFQEKLGINEKKYIDQLTEARTGREIKEIVQKIEKAASKWYERRLMESRAYEPIDHSEFGPLNKQLQGLLAWFRGDTSKRTLLDMAITHENFEKDIKHQKEFRNKLRRQSTFVRTEYFRRVRDIEIEEKNRSPVEGAPTKDRRQLLDEIIEEIKEVQDAPNAIQYEFSKLQKKKAPGKTTKDFKEEVTKTYEIKTQSYRKEILENMQYFGGETVKTPYGEMTETAWEFIEWFEDQESFAAMDSARKKLPNLIRERRRLFKRRDDILDHANPEERDRLREKTQKMRRHELEAFMPELEANVRKNSVHVLEYLGLLHTARFGNISVFTREEVLKMSIQFKLKNVKEQEAYLIVLQDSIAERKKTVAAYFNLPIHARNDEEFLKANSYEREKMLVEAYEQLNREKQNPLAISNAESKTSTEIVEELLSKLTTEPGERIVSDTIDEISQQGQLEIAENQLAIRSKMFGVSEQMETEDLTFKGAYLADLAKWMRTSKDLWMDEGNVKSERDQWKYETLQTAREMYDYGIVFTSGGQIQDLQTVNMDDVRKGRGSAVDRVHQARYSQHTLLVGNDGKDVLDPMDEIKNEVMPELLRVVELLLIKLGYGKAKLSSSVMSVIKNSENIQKELTKQLINGEFAGLMDLDGANNTDHFVQEVVQAA